MSGDCGFGVVGYLKLNQEDFWMTPALECVAMTHQWASCLGDRYYSMKGLAWDINTDILSCPEVCMAFSRTVSAYHLGGRGGGFLVVQGFFVFFFF